MSAVPGRTLVAGFGNVLRGDDGFGVEVVRRLADRGRASSAVELLDVGTGGIRLAQELLGGYDRLIIVDAATRGGTPGTVYTLVVDGVEPTREIDMHTTIPSRALEVAQAFGPLPREIFLVGCEPESVDELTTSFTAPVAAAVDRAVHAVERLLMADAGQDAAPGGGDVIARQDELLELLYWLEGEGLGDVATLDGIGRFTALPAPVVAATLGRLAARGDIAQSGTERPEYRLTETGRREAARRFAAEFAPLLSQGHGECSDPGCDCHTSEGGPAECHARTHPHPH